MVILVTRRLKLSPPTIFIGNLFNILEILDKFNCFVKFRSITNIFTQQNTRKLIEKKLVGRLKIVMPKKFSKKIISVKCVAKSTGSDFDLETVPSKKKFNI